MPSSIFSSDRTAPDLPWPAMLATAMATCLAFIALMEIRLDQLDYRPAIRDSAEKWAEQRARASALGSDALVLVGASRIQLGIDLDALRLQTGLEPVQLAIDGSSFVPILNNLADDPSVRGTILVDYSPNVLEDAFSGDYGVASKFLRVYQMQPDSDRQFTLARAEKRLTEHLRNNLRSYADGASPLLSLTRRIMSGRAASHYLETRPDRSRLADYSRVPMPAFYYQRVARHLGGVHPIAGDTRSIEEALRQKIAALPAHDNAAYLRGARHVKQLASRIEARGGRVVFIAMPTSGMIRDIDENRYPRSSFAGLLEKEAGISVLDSVADRTLATFTCPDGSHLDKRDRERFTTSLLISLRRSGRLNGH